MPVERPRAFEGVPRYNGFQRSGTVASSATISPQASRASQLGLGLGKGAIGLGKGKTMKRHKKIPRDTIRGITKGDIRRLARRGGVKRMSAMVYDDIRSVIKQRLELIIRQVVALVELSGRKTVCVTDVIFVLYRLGKPIYGFDPNFA